MKRYGNLYAKIVDINNIKKAIKCASKNKTHRYLVQKVLEDIDNRALELQQMLINHTYIPSEYVVMEIYDSHRHKYRTLKKPKFYPDQCIHWCLMLICEPLFEKRMYKWSCSSIKGRGTHYAKNYIKGALKDDKNTKYVYQLDIHKFYQSVDNEILKTKLRKMFKDRDVLWLFDKIIDTDKGLPIGNYTSQWLANFYLTDLDNYIKKDLGVEYYARYADDMILFSSNKRKMQKDRLKIEKYITNENLSLKPNWQVYKRKTRPIDFVGFVFFDEKITLRKDIYLRIKRRAKRIGKKGYININDARTMTSYWGYITHSDSYYFYITDIKPYCDIKKCKEKISNETKKQFKNHKTI